MSSQGLAKSESPEWIRNLLEEKNNYIQCWWEMEPLLHVGSHKGMLLYLDWTQELL